MNIKWINKFDKKQVGEIHSLMKNEWWCCDRRLADVSQVINGSDFVLGAVDMNESIVGFARVLTDYIYKAVIFDVIVSPSQRNKGLGKEIILMILGSEKLMNVKSFELYCPDRVSGFYEKIGFTESSSKLMRVQAKKAVVSDCSQ